MESDTNELRVYVYYKPNFGYIIGSGIKIKEMAAYATLYPAIYLDDGISDYDLGSSIIEAFRLSESSVEVDISYAKDKKKIFWDHSGYKSWKAFSKDFFSVTIKKKKNNIVLIRDVRDSYGGFVYSEEESDTIQLDANATSSELSNSVKHLMNKNVTKQENATVTFQTLNNNIVEYSTIPDFLIDIDDGGTDAYKIYIDEENDENYIGFFIEPMYEGLSIEEVKEKAYREYGDIVSYRYEKKHKEDVEYAICIKTKDKEIMVLGYKDDDIIMEVIYEIDTKKNTNRIDSIRDSFKKIIDSMLFKKF